MKSNLYRLIPNGWHWLLKVENQDWTWLLESFAVMADKALGVKTYGQYERNLDKIQAMNPLSNLYHNLEEEFIPNPLCYNEKP